MTVANLAGNCQKKSDTVCVEVSLYDTLLSKYSNNKEQVKSLTQLKSDTARLNQLIKFKDQAFLALKSKSDANWDDYKKLKGVTDSVISDMRKVITMKDDKIAKLEARNPSLGKRILGILAAVVTGYAIGKF